MNEPEISCGETHYISGSKVRRVSSRVATQTERRDGADGSVVAQVRGFLAERIVVSTMLDPFLSLKALAVYASVSVRKLRGYLDDPAHPLPHYRVGGKIVVRRSEFDAWIALYRQVGQTDVGGVVDSVMRDLRS